ncbi:penicillin-binding protein 2 [Massilia sp.]|uniref:penicillin-binding protein 2 n=1 Tax=Massilia sp. TaxID=1882437 RepID=UPI00289B85BF|nr:penicillin-binding protein 2 [Massilia sp.]
MIDFQDRHGELRRFRRRLLALFAFVLLCFGLLAARLAWLQVARHEHYMAQSDGNRIALLPVVPTRGLILDRNGVVLARNQPVHTLEVTPSKLRARLGSVLDELAKLVAIDARDRRRLRRQVADNPPFAASLLRSGLTDEEVARFTAQRFRFPGVELRARLLRDYPLGELAAHAVGYVGRIDAAAARALEAAPDPGVAANYRGTDYIGKEGLEKSYERLLHGRTGYEQVERTAAGRPVRTLSRVEPVPGANLVLSLDIGLQRVVEQAFGDARGALVAIEPASGEVLAFVSRPGYDPNLFVGGIDPQSWRALNTSPDRPLLNRPLAGTYAPGSTFKPFMALAALELGKRNPAQSMHDAGYFMLGGHRFNDDKPGGHGEVDLYRSILVSCDTWCYQLGNELGIDAISAFMARFGFGAPTGIDLDHERAGVLPSQDWKRRRFARGGRWNGGDTISISIGQGYNSYTMLQLAHAVALLANDGLSPRPHLLRALEDGVTHARRPFDPGAANRLTLRQAHLDLVKRAMVGVTTERDGTGYKVFRGAAYTAGGKSGTAQVVGLNGGKYDHHGTPEHLRDNALFTAYAPAERPRIAIAVVVENAGWGSAVAGPIVRKALDYYLAERD